MKKLISSLLLITPFLCFAQIPPPNLGSHILDNANVLTAQQEVNLSVQINSIENKLHIQIAIVLIRQLPGNASIEDYARQIGRTWHVGNAHNGLVYVAAIDQHKQRLEVASELEGTITDLRAEELTENIKGFFRHKQYYEGISSMLTSIGVMLKPVEKEQAKLTDKALQKKKDADSQFWHTYLYIFAGSVVLICIILCFLALVWELKRKSKKLKQEQDKDKLEEAERRKRNWDKLDQKLATDPIWNKQKTKEDSLRAAARDVTINAFKAGIRKIDIQQLLISKYAAKHVTDIAADRIAEYIAEMLALIEEYNLTSSNSTFMAAGGVVNLHESEPTRYESPSPEPTPYESSSPSPAPDYGSNSTLDTTSGFDGGGASNDW